MRIITVLILMLSFSGFGCRPAGVQKGQDLETQLAEMNKKSRERANASWQASEAAQEGLGDRDSLATGTIKVPVGFSRVRSTKGKAVWQGPSQPSGNPKIVCSQYELKTYQGTVKDVSIQDAIRKLSKEKMPGYTIVTEMELGKIGEYQASRESWERGRQSVPYMTYLIIAGNHIVQFDLIDCSDEFLELCEAAVYSYQHDAGEGK